MAIENLRPLVASDIEISDDTLRINNFETSTKSIVEVFKSDNENAPLDLLEQILKLGAETYRIMGTSATSEILENVAHEVRSGMEAKKIEIVADMQDLAQKMVAESGDLSVKGVLQSWRTEFDQLLRNSFDSNRADSIMQKFDTAMKTWAENQQDRVIGELNLNKPGSSLYGLNDKIEKHITKSIENVQEQIKSIETALGIEEATKEVRNKVASRGTDFEDLVFEIVDEISGEYRDTADNPGKSKKKGVDGNDEGDITVDVNSESTGGAELRFVWECKVRSSKQSDRWLYDELQKGMTNRQAIAGVIVTDSVTAGGTNWDGKFWRETGNMATLILDPLDPDANSIRFAYLWSRWIVRRDNTAILDVGSVKEVMENIQRELSVITAIKSHHSKMYGELDLVRPKVEGLETNVKIQLEKLTQIIENASKEAE